MTHMGLPFVRRVEQAEHARAEKPTPNPSSALLCSSHPQFPSDTGVRDAQSCFFSSKLAQCLR